MTTGTTSPHNNWIELIALGRHGPCFRKARAGDPQPLYLPVQGLRSCSQLIQALSTKLNTKFHYA